jgi:hypothetical protein
MFGVSTTATQPPIGVNKQTGAFLFPTEKRCEPPVVNIDLPCLTDRIFRFSRRFVRILGWIDTSDRTPASAEMEQFRSLRRSFVQEQLQAIHDLPSNIVYMYPCKTSIALRQCDLAMYCCGV